MATILLLVMALVAVTAAGCGSSANAAGGTLKVGEADNGKSFTVKVGDTIQVIIAGNPTTGHSWAAAMTDKDAALIEQVGEPEYTTETQESIVGAGGVYKFTFKATAKGEALLKLAYARPWENVAPEQTFAVTLTIK
jgi:inhibitor of cysteine peptidase